MIREFTGYHDKNNMPIHDGDIIRWGVHIGSVKKTTHKGEEIWVFADDLGLFPCCLKAEIIAMPRGGK